MTRIYIKIYMYIIKGVAKLGLEEDDNVNMFLEDRTVIEDENALMCDWLQ